MPTTLDPDLRRALAERVRYCHEMGIYDFYRREAQVAERAPLESSVAAVDDPSPTSHEQREEMAAKKSATVAKAVTENVLEVLTPKPEHGVSDPITALKLIREDLGDCTRCKLHKQGRKQIVFGVGNPRAELMFVAKAPAPTKTCRVSPSWAAPANCSTI
jgi:DNA polymerase